MTHVKLTIDGEVQMDGDLGSWSKEPPAVSDLKLKAGVPGSASQWSMAVLQVIAAAAVKRVKSTTIEVTTRAGGWTLDVSNA